MRSKLSVKLPHPYGKHLDLEFHAEGEGNFTAEMFRKTLDWWLQKPKDHRDDKRTESEMLLRRLNRKPPQ